MCFILNYSQEDDITAAYNELIFTTNGILDQVSRPLDNMTTFFTSLQYISASVINSEVKFPPQYDRNLKVSQTSYHK